MVGMAGPLSLSVLSHLPPPSTRWGKRAAHNRAQIVYYIAENLELRHKEVAQRIADMTGDLYCHWTSSDRDRGHLIC